MHHSNPSEYTLLSVPAPSESDPLIPDDSHATPTDQHSSSRLLFRATIRMAALFLCSTLILGGTLFLALPSLQPDDRPLLRIPKSFDDLKALNGLLKRYRDIYPARIAICYVTTYLFLQAFSLPGSMYLAILGGAVWGVPIALPLACTCVATGATLCYLISAAFGPALLTLPKWKSRLDKWSTKLAHQKDNIFSFLIILRIAPLPPHWVINIVCPHVGIRLLPFWTSTWFGVFGTSVIHTTIGGGLDEMTSADDFHLVSWKNFVLLSAVVVGVLIPVALRYFFEPQTSSVTDVEQGENLEPVFPEHDHHVLAVGPAPLSQKQTSLSLGTAYVEQVTTFYADEETEVEDEDGDDADDYNDDDVILEAGPAIVIKSKDEAASSSGSAAI